MPEAYLHPELVNIAEDLSKDELDDIARVCLEDYKADEESRQEWMEMHAHWLNLYYLKDRPINPPWEGSSDESLPMLAEAATQFHSRAYKAMFPGRDVIKAIPVGRWDKEADLRAQRVGKHLSWQLTVRNDNYKRDKDRLLLALPIHGSVFTKAYYCPIRKRNITDNVRAVDLCVPYGSGPRDVEDVERKSQIIWSGKQNGIMLADEGFFLLPPEPRDLEEKSELDAAHDNNEGLSETVYSDRQYCKIIEQHRYLDLDDDGREEPYIVSVDTESEKVLRIAIRYDTDEAGNPTDGKRPVEYFTHYPFIENPDGFYGLGWGHLVGPLNTAANKILRQAVDAGTLANVGANSGFISDMANIKGGEVQMQLGKFIKVSTGGEDINKMFWTPKFGGPNESLLSVLTMLHGLYERLAATEVTTGQVDKVMQPTAIANLIEQSQQANIAVYDRVMRAWEMELRKHFRLNRKFLDPVEYFNILDAGGQVENAQVAREDYEDDFQIIPIGDSQNVTKREKLIKAQAMYETLIQNPLVTSDFVRILAVTRRYLEAMEIEYVDEVLPTPEQAFQLQQAMAQAAQEAKEAEMAHEEKMKEKSGGSE